MSTLKNVGNKLFKVELGLVDDVRKKITLIDDLSKKMDIELKKHQAAKKIYDDSLKSLLDSKTQYFNNTKDVMSISRKMIDTAKDLGVNVETLKEYNMLWDSVKNGNKITDIIEGLDS